MQENSGITKTRIFHFVFTLFSFVSKCDLQGQYLPSCSHMLHVTCGDNLENEN